MFTVQDLINEARAVQGAFDLDEVFRAAVVGAALRTKAGNIFTGVSLELACGIGFCAEHSAVAEMLKHRETHIEAVVAVSPAGVIPPCGRCRELMAQVDRRNLDTEVIVSAGKAVALRTLLPMRWY